MKKPLQPLALAFVTALAVRVALAVLMWEPGWSALTWDDFSRVSIAQSWAADPYLVGDLVWLPGQAWFAGLVYRGFGDQFLANPMVLMAVLNTVAVMATSVVTAWSAWLLFRSKAGAFIAMLAVMFSPWGFFTSLSGLNEPIYYLAVAAGVGGFAAWMTTNRPGWLLGAAGAFAVACTLRYEGWWLAAGWAATALWRSKVVGGDRWLGSTFRLTPILALPFVVPAAWFVVNYERTGDPLFFARESARYFLSAYGNDLFDSIPERLTYYPFAAVRSAPLLLVLIAGLLYAQRNEQRIRHFALVPVLAFIPFYGTSLLSPAVGAFTERFMFAFVLALVPVLGSLPSVARAVVPARYLRVTVVGLAVVGLAVTTVRTLDRPVEWTHAPDLLALNQELGEATSKQRPLTVVLGEELTIESIPFTVQNGNRVLLYTAADLGLDDPSQLPADFDLWIERLPAAVAGADQPADGAIGRYHLWWNDEAPLDPGVNESIGWIFESEDGTLHAPISSVFVPLEFTSDDPPPGSRASLTTTIERGPTESTGTIRLRWLYGHGFNAGRIEVEVMVDGRRVWATDISSPSRWTDVDFTIPAGQGASTVAVAVVAKEGIEAGWAWGRASSVLVDELVVTP